MTACLHHVILQRLLQPRCSTRSTSTRRTRDKRGGRGGRRGAGELHPKEPIKKGGFMNVSQSESSHLSPQNLYYTASPLQPFLSTSCLLSTLTAFFFLFTCHKHSFIKVNALRTPPRRSVCHQNASHDGEDCQTATCHYR